VEGDNIGFEGPNGTKITVLGVSAQVEVQKVKLANYLACRVQEDTHGIIVIDLAIPKIDGRNSGHEQYVIPIGWGDDKLIVDLKTVWVPPISGRIPCLSIQGIEVVIDDEIFSSYRDEPGVRKVPDADILCQYLIGELNDQEVRVLVTAYVEEVSATKRVKELEGVIAKLESELTDTNATVSDLKAELLETQVHLENAQKSARMWARYSDQLNEAIDRVRWVGWRARRMLAEAKTCLDESIHSHAAKTLR